MSGFVRTAESHAGELGGIESPPPYSAFSDPFDIFNALHLRFETIQYFGHHYRTSSPPSIMQFKALFMLGVALLPTTLAYQSDCVAGYTKNQGDSCQQPAGTFTCSHNHDNLVRTSLML
jgi:hypothetical protein